MKQLILWPFLITSVLFAPLAHACSCAGKADCGAFQIRNTLFVGKALSVRMTESSFAGVPFPVHRRIYRFEVTEALNLAPRAAEVIEIETGMGGGDCGYGFEIGQSYLVDAGRYGESGQLSTGICSATQPERQATNLVREVRAILAHQRLPDLSGTVVRQDSLYGSARAKPLVGVTVHLTPANGNAFNAVTDYEGIYTVLDLPVAEYRVDFDLPPNLVTYEGEMERTPTIKIPRSGGTACHLNAVALPSGTISGQVVNAKGEPVSAFGTISLRKSGETHDEQVSSNNDANGHFIIHFVKAGEYRVVYRVWGRGPVQETWLEPSVAFPQGTAVVQEGEHLSGINLLAK